MITKIGLYRDPRKKKPWVVRWFGEYDPTTEKQRRYLKAFRLKTEAEEFQGHTRHRFDFSLCWVKFDTIPGPAQAISCHSGSKRDPSVSAETDRVLVVCGSSVRRSCTWGLPDTSLRTVTTSQTPPPGNLRRKRCPSTTALPNRRIAAPPIANPAVPPADGGTIRSLMLMAGDSLWKRARR